MDEDTITEMAAHSAAADRARDRAESVPDSERGQVEVHEWGVAYEFDENGRPIWPVELADDEQDARDWAQASGDPDAKVMHRRITYGAWEVAG